MSNDERWPLQLLNYVRHSERLSRSGYTQQRLPPQTTIDAISKIDNRLWLVTRWLVFGYKIEWHTEKFPWSWTLGVRIRECDPTIPNKRRTDNRYPQMLQSHHLCGGSLAYSSGGAASAGVCT